MVPPVNDGRTGLTYKNVVFIHAARQGSTVSVAIEAASSVPADDDYNSYYIIGYIDNKGVVTQEHHGGTPLFVFFENC